MRLPSLGDLPSFLSDRIWVTCQRIFSFSRYVKTAPFFLAPSDCMAHIGPFLSFSSGRIASLTLCILFDYLIKAFVAYCEPKKFSLYFLLHHVNAKSVSDTTNEIEKKHLTTTEHSDSFILDIVRLCFSYMQSLFDWFYEPKFRKLYAKKVQNVFKVLPPSRGLFWLAVNKGVQGFYFFVFISSLFSFFQKLLKIYLKRPQTSLNFAKHAKNNPCKPLFL